MAAEVNSGLEGVVAAETTISLVDGQAGRLLYRGYEIGDLAAHGSYDRVVGLLLDGDWPLRDEVLPPAELSPTVLAALRGLPTSCAPLDALRTAFSAFGAERRMDWPPTAAQARELVAIGPAAVGAFARLRDNKQPVDSAESAHLGAAARLLHAITGEQPDPAKARALDAYFTVCAEHGLNASTFTARVITSTQSDLASAVCGAVGALKGRLHGGAPSEVRDQLTQIGDVEHAEVWIREALARGERLMGFGHRVYKTMDPRAAAGGRASRGRRRLAAAGDRRRGRGAAAAGRAQARPPAEDQRRVLRLDRAGRSRPADRSLHAGIRGRPHRGLDGARARAGRPRAADPPRLPLRRPRSAAAARRRVDPLETPEKTQEHSRATHSRYPASRSASISGGVASGGQTEPSRIADSPHPSSGPTAGNANRLAGTDSGASRPKCHQAIGVVTSVQATDTATADPSEPCSRGATAKIAHTAAKLSWKPGLNRSSGFRASTTAAPQASRCQRAD